MSKKTIGLILFTVVLAAVYVYYFTDFFSEPIIAISWRPRVERSRGSTPAFSGSFSFDTRSKVRLTEIKVVPLAELETNKYAHAVWHMISEKGSSPTKGIVYGEMLKGMKPNIPKMKAEPLQPGTKYRIFVESGKRKGTQDFDVPGQKRVQ
jgi:hypothetical protein